jgi:hypothetical protein
MRGPAARWKHDVRRVWECPACGRRERTGGHIVNRACDCRMKEEPAQRTWMRLLEETGKRPPATSEAPEQPSSEVGLQQPLTGADPPQ